MPSLPTDHPFPPAPPLFNGLPPERRDALLASICDSVSDLIAIFEPPGLTPIYLNSAALRLLLPNYDGEGLGASTLKDFVGVGFVSRLESEVIVHTRVLGRWSGDCVLRDEWGCEHGVFATFTRHGRPGEGDCIILRAVARAGEKPASDATSDGDLLHALLESVPDAVYFKDTRGRFIRASLSMAKRDGQADASALIGRTDFDRMDASAAASAYDDEQQIVKTGKPLLEREEQIRLPDGADRWQLTSKLPLLDRGGRVIGTFGISRDISAAKRAENERRELEMQLQLSQKLESIGRLAAGIAHEINTPSQFITDNLRFLRESFVELAQLIATTGASAGSPTIERREIDYLLEEIPRTCEQSLEGMGRIARIVRSLKEFSHPGAPELAPTDLNHSIENVLAVSRHEWKYVADVVTELDPDLPLVPCVVDAFGQAMLNLVVNAAHAIEDSLKTSGGSRGTITIRTRREDDHAVLEIADTGTGIPLAVRDRIYEPFFTTKAVGRGTGQGLTIAHKIITHDHRGRMDFTTREGEGTTFRIHLPLAQSREPATSP